MTVLRSMGAVVALLACILGAALAPAAWAGDYSIYACAVPGREAADEGPWKPYSTGDNAFIGMPVSMCDAGFFGRSDALSGWDTYPYAGGFAGFRAEVPVGRPIEIRRVEVNGAVSYTRQPGSEGSLATTISPPERVLCDEAGDCESTWNVPFNAGTKAVSIGVTCYISTCSTGKTYSAKWKWAIITAAESEKPAVTATGGPLLDGGAQRGPRRLAYTATDADSGVAAIRVRFGDQTIAERRLSDDRAQCPRRSWNACPTSTSSELDVDTTKVGDGYHTVTVAVTDAAGNEATAVAGVVRVDNILAPTVVESPRIAGTPVVGEVLTGDAGRWSGATGATPLLQWKRCDAGGCAAIPGATGTSYRVAPEDLGRQLVLEATTANAIGETTAAQSGRTGAVSVRSVPAAGDPPATLPAALPAPNGSNATTKARLVARLAHGQATRRIRYGSSATVSGTLSDEDGRPISGAGLVVLQRVRMTGAKPAPIATVTTDSQGRFTYKAPSGPSRELEFGYRAYAADRDFASSTKVTVLVRASVSLKTTPSKLRNGQRLRFTGAVRGRPHGEIGPLVDLQVVVHGRWRSFLRGAVRADRKGRFKASYRFLRTRTAQTYRFRAVARQDSAYPYLAGTSAVRKVQVRP